MAQCLLDRGDRAVVASRAQAHSCFSLHSFCLGNFMDNLPLSHAVHPAVTQSAPHDGVCETNTCLVISLRCFWGQTLSLTNLVFNKAPRDAYYKCSLICAPAAMQSPVWRGVGTQEPSSFVHNQLSDKKDVDCTSGDQGIGKGGKETRESWEF